MSQDLESLLKSIAKDISADDIGQIKDECMFLCPIDNIQKWGEDMDREFTAKGFLLLLASEGYVTAGDLRLLRDLLEPLNRKSVLFQIDNFRRSTSSGFRQTAASAAHSCQPPVAPEYSGVLIEENSLDDVIGRISDRLGAQWRSFARKGLLLSSTVIDEISHKGRSEGSSLAEMGEQAMLRWKQAKGCGATREALREALRRAQQNLIADTEF